jgi:glucosamine-6-phosphate deaminase
MRLHVHPTAAEANAAAADLLARWLADSELRTVMLAGGNTPLDLYGCIATRSLRLERLHVFALDEYVGVPPGEPRNCANLIRRRAVEAWGVPAGQYFHPSSLESEALASVIGVEERIARDGGLDMVILGLGRNGHVGFNEPGSAEDSGARLVDLDAVSIEANREWFGGDYAPARGATAGMRTILGSQRILLLAYGSHKAAAVRAMAEGPRSDVCPASLLQGHPCVEVFLDAAATTLLKGIRVSQSRGV